MLAAQFVSILLKLVCLFIKIRNNFIVFLNLKMVSIKQYIVLLLAMASFVYTLYVVTHLIHFLSAPRKTSRIYTWVFNLLDNKSRMEAAYGPMVFNTIYLILFIFQHSFMKSSLVKKLMQNIGLASAERAIYSLTSSLCLHVRKSQTKFSTVG